MPIDGTEELNRNLNKLINNVFGGSGLKRALAAAGFVGEGGAKRRAAVDTGNMRARINLNEVTAKRNGGEAIIVAEAEYSIDVEFGTSKQKAQPFMRPTIDDDGDKMIRAFNNQIAQDIRKAF